MLLDLEVSEGEWFDYFGSHLDQTTGEVVHDSPVEGGPRMKIRNIQPFIEERMTARKQEVHNILNTKSRRMERVKDYKDLTTSELLVEREDTWDYVIQAFEGFKDKKTGKDIKCTKANKVKMMKLPVIDRFVARCLQLISESGVQEAEEETANLKPGSSSQTNKLDPE